MRRGPRGLSSGTSAGLEETGGWHTPGQVPGSGAGDLSTSTALPTRYLLYLTRLSRPTESRDWGEARGQSRARAGTSLDGILQCTLRNRPDCNGEYSHIHPARSAGPDTAVPGPVFSGPPSTYVCTCTCCNQAAHALTASEDRIHPCPWIHAMSDACGGGRYPATWACFDESSLHHRRNTRAVLHAYADSLA